MCHGVLCSLPLCTERTAGGMAGGIGRKKAHPAVKGDTPREAAHRRAHRFCEIEECQRLAAHLHHVDRRQNRSTSRLLMVCGIHHAAIHAGTLDDGRRTVPSARSGASENQESGSYQGRHSTEKR